MTTPEKSVEESVEECFKGIIDANKRIELAKDPVKQYEIEVKKQLTQTLKAERQKREEVDKRKLLEDFAEYAHTRYNGCVNDGEWQYQYDTEVVWMIDDYLTQPNNLK